MAIQYRAGDRRECHKIWAAKNREGLWFVYGTWGRGKKSVTRTLGYKKTKQAAENLVRQMKRKYMY